jgi:phospholipid/cholesterol/gamma-HCH transport system substrate-binding protein
MKKTNLEIVVGLFVMIGVACLAYLAIHLGELEWFRGGYPVIADFDNISGLKVGATVEVAGVDIGRVESISVTQDNMARLLLNLNKNVKIFNDAIASVRTKGIIGDKYVKLSLGGAGEPLPPGEKIRNTESAVEWEELISKFIQGKV